MRKGWKIILYIAFSIIALVILGFVVLSIIPRNTTNQDTTNQDEEHLFWRAIKAAHRFRRRYYDGRRRVGVSPHSSSSDSSDNGPDIEQ